MSGAAPGLAIAFVGKNRLKWSLPNGYATLSGAHY